MRQKQNLYRKIPKVMVNGVKYLVIKTNISTCMACRAQCDRDLCLSMPDCSDPYDCIYVQEPWHRQAVRLVKAAAAVFMNTTGEADQ